eukprot:15287162-Heterocapsa_arctica.AAC.1
MTENLLYDLAYKTRCFQGFHTTTPTDEHLVPDNILTNERRLGSYIAAKAVLGATAPVPVTGL